jgi:iron complex outermembrane receptor protein
LRPLVYLAPRYRPARAFLSAVALACLVGRAALAAEHQDLEPKRFEIPAQALASALVSLAGQADISIGLTGVVLTNQVSAPVSGTRTIAEALEDLLTGTGLTFEMIEPGTWRIFPRPLNREVRLDTPTLPLTLPPNEEIIVTAIKRPVALQTTSMSVAAVTGGTFTDYGVRSTQEMSAFVAGLSATNQGPGRNKFVIRGMSDGPFIGNTQSTVGLYIDETRVVFNAPSPALQLHDVDRVEVIRGPQGTLYGAGSIGGLVRIITRQPVMGRFEARAAAETSVTEGSGISHAADAVVNVPLAGDKVAWRTLAYRRSDAGYIEDTRLGGDAVNRTHTTGGRSTAKVRLGTDWTLSAGVIFQSIHAHDTQYYNAARPPFQRANFLREPNRNRILILNGTVEGDLGWASVTSTTAWIHHRVEAIFDASLAIPTLIRMPVEPTLFDQRNLYRTINHETRLASSASERWNWIAGVFFSHRYDRSTATLTRVEETPADVFYVKNRYDYGTEAAAFSEVQYRLTPELRAGVGLRVYYGDGNVEANNSQLIEDGPPQAIGRNEKTGATPKAEISYQAGRDHFFYTQATRGFRLGGVNIASRISAPPPGGRPVTVSNFDSDGVWNFEVGSKSTFFDQRLNMNVTLFYALWDDMQADLIRPNGLSFTSNLGNGRNKGIELETIFAATERLRFLANVSWNDPTVPSTGMTGAVTNRLPGAPKFAGAVAAQYQYPLGGGFTGFVNVKSEVIGKAALAIGTLPMASVPAYHTANLRTGVFNEHWRVSAYVTNLTDTTSNTYAFGNPFMLGRIPQAIPVRPRTFGVTVSWTR